MAPGSGPCGGTHPPQNLGMFLRIGDCTGMLLAFGSFLARLAVGKAVYEICLSLSLSSHNNLAIFMF